MATPFFHSAARDDVDANPGKFVRCLCNGQEFVIPVADGTQTVKWLAMTLAHRVKNDKETHGRLQQRQRMSTNDGREVCVPIPLMVTCGESKVFCDPRKKIKDLLTEHGTDLEFQIQMGFDVKPNEEGGVFLRQDIVEKPKKMKQFRIDDPYVCGDRVSSTSTKGHGESVFVAKRSHFVAKGYPANDSDNWVEMPSAGPSWCDLAFCREGRQRYEKYLNAEKKVKKIESLEHAKLHPPGPGADLMNAKALAIGDDLENIALEDLFPTETTDKGTAQHKVEQLLRTNYDPLCRIFNHFTFSDLMSSDSRDADGRLFLVELLHFCLQASVYGPAEEAEQILEGLYVDIARAEMARRSKAHKQPPKEEKKSDQGDVGASRYLKEGLPRHKFLEVLVRIACQKYRLKNGMKKSQAMTSIQINTEFRHLLSTAIPIFERHVNIKSRRLLQTPDVQSLIVENFDSMKEVFTLYGRADANKSDDQYTNQNSVNYREFMLLCTDSLLAGECPGDTSEDAQKTTLTAFLGSQARDESHANNAINQSEAQRLTESFLPEMIYSEFVEAVVRIALRKWDDPSIPNNDKIQLSFEAISVLSQ